MPELPEVETIVRGLRSLIRGYTIENLIIRAESLVAYPPGGISGSIKRQNY